MIKILKRKTFWIIGIAICWMIGLSVGIYYTSRKTMFVDSYWVPSMCVYSNLTFGINPNPKMQYLHIYGHTMRPHDYCRSSIVMEYYHSYTIKISCQDYYIAKYPLNQTFSCGISHDCKEFREMDYATPFGQFMIWFVLVSVLLVSIVIFLQYLKEKFNPSHNIGDNHLPPVTCDNNLTNTHPYVQ